MDGQMDGRGNMGSFLSHTLTQGRGELSQQQPWGPSKQAKLERFSAATVKICLVCSHYKEEEKKKEKKKEEGGRKGEVVGQKAKADQKKKPPNLWNAVFCRRIIQI